MEKIENRKRFIEKLAMIAQLVQLTPEFVQGLQTHPYFQDYMAYIQGFTEPVKIIFILLELTRERSTCQAVVNLLHGCGQTEAAKQLAEFNRSTGPMPLIYSLTLEVARCLAPKKDLSNCYNLLKKKRGKCIIVNTMEEPQKPDLFVNNHTIRMIGLRNETIRFTDLFEKLNFNVEVITRMNSNQLKQKLESISKDMSLGNDEALIFMAISHGEDEKVLGFDACDVIRRANFGLIPEAARDEALQVISEDVLDIKDIIAIFSDEQCPHLKGKPKLFFFTCCRNQAETQVAAANVNPNQGPIKITPKKLGSKPSVDIFVAYACSKGYKTFFDPIHGYSFFGQALSHSIAQYACEESLSQIMSRTSKRLKKMYEEIDEDGKKELMGSFAIEVTTYAMNNQLYFNPGISE